MPDTHEDIRRRLFDAAWETPAYAPAPERTVTRARRRAALTIGGGAILLAAVAVTIFTLGGGAPLADQHRTGEPVHGDDPRETLVDTTTGDRSAFDALPPGAWLYDISPRRLSRSRSRRRQSGRTQVWIMGMDGTGLRQLTHDPFEAIDPTWSPDGTRIVYVGFGEVIRAISSWSTSRVGSPTRSSPSPRILGTPDGHPMALGSCIGLRPRSTFPPELPTTTTSLEVRSVIVDDRSGQRACRRAESTGGLGGRRGTGVRTDRVHRGAVQVGSSHASHSLWLMDGDGSRKEQLLSLDADDASDTAWSPDGSQIAFIVAQHGEAFVHVFDLATGEDRRIDRAIHRLGRRRHTSGAGVPPRILRPGFLLASDASCDSWSPLSGWSLRGI